MHVWATGIEALTFLTTKKELSSLNDVGEGDSDESVVGRRGATRPVR